VWVRAWGKSLKEAFEECVNGLMKTMVVGWPDKIESKETREIELEDIDKETLLVGFLSEYLYYFDVEKMIFKTTEVKTLEKVGEEKWKIKAISKGEEFDSEKHQPDTEVKAITYSYIQVEETENGAEIKIVFDI